jgi:hypothetical protein
LWAKARGSSSLLGRTRQSDMTGPYSILVEPVVDPKFGSGSP